MLLRYVYDRSLAHASYLVGCQKSGEAIVIDPGRDIEPYVQAAAAEGLRIVAAAETHIHADFVSGSLELASRLGAKLYLSDEGPADWKYAFADRVDAQLLKDGDRFSIGGVRFDVLHTPGHTPESISFLLTDIGGGADAPMGIFTGDFVFVGSIGRPDLLETAAGVVGSAEAGAHQLFHSVERFRTLPDHLQVWPAHGAGSACGKGLGAVPSSTVGYEKRFNPALQIFDEDAFVEYILSDQPETPPYFAVMKRVNKVGPQLLEALPEVPQRPAAELPATAKTEQVIDTSPAAEFARGHVPGTIHVPEGMLAQWAGFLVDYERPLYLLSDAASLPAHLKALRSIGIDNVAGFFDRDEVAQAGLRTEATPRKMPEELQASIERGDVQLLDVRSASEYQAGHIPGAASRFLGTLPRQLDAIDKSRPVVTHCQGGARSAIAASLLQKAGFDVIDMQGGFQAWSAAGLPTRD